MAVRTTVYLEESVLERVRRFVPQRKLSRFVNDALAEKSAALERREVQEAMKEGYLTTRDDRDELNKDWGVVDVEDWPE